MNRHIKTALPLFCLIITACAHFSDIPAQNNIGAMPASTFGRSPTEEEAQNGLKRELRTVTAKYLWPPQKMCWGDSWQWKLHGQYYCGWGVKIQPEGFSPYLALFQTSNPVGLAPGIPNSGQPLWWQQGPQNQEKWFAIPAQQSSATAERLSEIVVNQAEYDKRMMAKSAETERETALASGARICKKIGLDSTCYETLSLDELTKTFGKDISRADKVAFYNAHHTSEQIHQALQEQETKRLESNRQAVQWQTLNAQQQAAATQQEATNLQLLNTLQHSFQPIYQPPIRNTNCYTSGGYTNCTGY